MIGEDRMFDIDYNYKYSENGELLYTMKEVAALINNKKAGRNTILKLMREEGILDEDNQLKEEYNDNGLFYQDRSIGYDPFGKRLFHPVRCTAKGIEHIYNLVKKKIPILQTKPIDPEISEFMALLNAH